MRTVFSYGGENPFTRAKAESLIQVDQSETKEGLFKVTYGLQEKNHLTYAQAAHELGECIFHYLACESVLNNNGL